MSVPGNVRAKAFIDTLANTPSDQVKPRNITNFQKAINLVYGENVWKQVVERVFSEGSKAFQDRFIEIAGVDGALSGAEQQTLAVLTQKVCVKFLLKLDEVPSDKVVPMNITLFMNVLDCAYGKETREEAIKRINPEACKGTVYVDGVKNYKEYLEMLRKDNGDLRGVDQKYIADYTGTVFGHNKAMIKK